MILGNITLTMMGTIFQNIFLSIKSNNFEPHEIMMLFSGSPRAGHHHPGGSGSGKGRSHRGRTVLTEKQRTILTACFQHNPKPDALLKASATD